MKYCELIETEHDLSKVKVWHGTRRRLLRRILKIGLDPNMTHDGDKAVYVWSDWGLLTGAVNRADDGESEAYEAILELTVPQSWLVAGDENEPMEEKIYRHVPPEMIKVVVLDVRRWDGMSYPGGLSSQHE